MWVWMWATIAVFIAAAATLWMFKLALAKGVPESVEKWAYEMKVASRNGKQGLAWMYFLLILLRRGKWSAFVVAVTVMWGALSAIFASDWIMRCVEWLLEFWGTPANCAPETAPGPAHPDAGR